MQYKISQPVVDRKKVVVFYTLAATALAITLSGAFFSVYSYLNNLSFKVLNTQVSGIIFGLTVVYLGIRYIKSVNTLRKELYKTTSVFSWDNFKKKAKNK